MKTNRRNFIKKTSFALAASTVPFSNIYALKPKETLGVALVGLGYYSTDVLAPALKLTKHCRLTGIVTGSPHKIPKWQKQYGIKDKNVYNYDNMHEITNNPDIDVIYIVLPTGLHAKYAIKAANSGKHVWCEKPMARTAIECQAIIDACKKNKVKLSIGYRMQHEPNTQKIMKWAKTKPYGDIQTVSARAGYYDPRENHWKLKKEMGGGALYDMGVYSINGIRYSTGEEPIKVLSASHSTERPELFSEVDETTFFKFEFPSGAIGRGWTSFGKSMNELTVTTKDGFYILKPFQSYSGVRGYTCTDEKLLPFKGNQQAKQMDDDSLSILNNTNVLVPGEEGMKDIVLVEAIYKSAKTGSEVKL
ncbi:Gfo/Idh/MocA family protein [Spongiivirga citrea]|uniref:Gfo/Idh/MocA family oxidoreductase n=1 Tax=Spongiivirga citrea TaxID=1481457 RepID=A0A6M0CWC6_9FLAO|nr:Gfo/Idh/MocA family oxidoreductase [Spongiivirga citrea]NER18040.1 Gfo/Idh/MocA family oxidoreductase [Spongiivirga citrea]